MSNLPVDRDSNYMREMWGTSKLITDYGYVKPRRVIQEVMHDIAPKHDLKKQTELHEKFVTMKTMMIGTMELNQHTDLHGNEHK